MNNAFFSKLIALAFLIMVMVPTAHGQDPPVPDDQPAAEQAEPAADTPETDETVEVPVEEVIISKQKCAHELLWYVDGVYAYSMKTLKKSGDAWIPNDQEPGVEVAFFNEEISAGAKSDDDENCACNSDAKPVAESVTVDPLKTVGWIQGRTDFRSNYYQSGDNFYQAIYFTVNGKNDEGESRTYQYRVAFPCKSAPIEGSSLNKNNVTLSGNTLVVENPVDEAADKTPEGENKDAPKAEPAKYPLFGTAALVAEEEKVEEVKVEESKPPMPEPDMTVSPQPEADSEVNPEPEPEPTLEKAAEPGSDSNDG